MQSRREIFRLSPPNSEASTPLSTASSRLVFSCHTRQCNTRENLRGKIDVLSSTLLGRQNPRVKILQLFFCHPKRKTVNFFEEKKKSEVKFNENSRTFEVLIGFPKVSTLSDFTSIPSVATLISSEGNLSAFFAFNLFASFSSSIVVRKDFISEL